MKQVVSKTIENSERLDKLKEVLTRDIEVGEDIEELVSDLITVQNESEIQWSAGFLKQFNRVCKYEKELEKTRLAIKNQRLSEQGKLTDREENKLHYTRVLEPLIRY